MAAQTYKQLHDMIATWDEDTQNRTVFCTPNGEVLIRTNGIVFGTSNNVPLILVIEGQ
jgi:hypothetical protein